MYPVGESASPQREKSQFLLGGAADEGGRLIYGVFDRIRRLTPLLPSKNFGFSLCCLPPAMPLVGLYREPSSGAVVTKEVVTEPRVWRRIQISGPNSTQPYNFDRVCLSDDNFLKP